MPRSQESLKPRRRILVVDYNASMLGSVSKQLERAGFEVVQAGTASQAIAELERNRDLHCAVIDMELGRISGLVVVDWLRAMRRQMNVILASGYDEPRLPSGVYLLPKPYTIEQLQDAIAVRC